MADNPYLSGGSSGGSGGGNPYLSASEGGSSGGGGNWFSRQVHNLPEYGSHIVSDVGAIGSGIFPGILQTVEHPIRTAQNVAHTEYQNWAPFVSGYKHLVEAGFYEVTGNSKEAQKNLDAYKRLRNQYNTNFKEHPVFMGLDAAFLIGGGTARLGALSTLGKDAAAAGIPVTLSDVTKAGLLGKRTGNLRTIEVLGADATETVPTRTLPRNYASAARVENTDKILKLLNPNFPVLGEYTRAAKAAKREERVAYLRAISSSEFTRYQRAYGKLNKFERAAWASLGRTPLLEDFDAWMEILRSSGTRTGKQTEAILNSPKARALVENPNPKLSEALAAGKGLSDLRGDILLRMEAITPEEIAAGIYSHTRFARGAKVISNSETYKRLRKVDAMLARLQDNKTRLLGYGRKFGQADIRLAIQEGRNASYEAARSSKMRARYRDLMDKFDQAETIAHDLRDATDAAMRGELDYDTLTALGIKLNPTEKMTAVAAAIKKAELERDLREAQLQHDKLHPEAQGPWRQSMKAEIERITQEINDIDSGVHSGGQEEARASVLRQLYDKLGPAYENYEKALTAEYVLQREIRAGELHARRQGRATDNLKVMRERRIQGLKAIREQFEDVIDLQMQQQLVRQEVEAQRGTLVGGGSEKGIAQEIKEAKRPEPFYIPDLPATKGKNRFALPEGSIAATRAKADVYQSRGTLFRQGMIAIHEDVLTPAFLRSAKHEFYTNLHTAAMRLARPVARGSGLPAHHEWLRTKKGEKISFETQHLSEHLRETADVFGDEFADKEFFTLKAGESEDLIATDAAGNRLAIATKFADHFRHDFSSAQGLPSKIWERASDVWRALILHLRIPWLESNIFGNTMLYAVRFSGPKGLSAFLGLVSRTRGAEYVGKLLNTDFSRKHLSEEFMIQHAPEQLRGTYLGTNLPPSLLENAPKSVQRAAKVPKAILGFLPKIDRAYEARLRRAATEAVLKESPEVQRIYKAMPKQTRRFEDAAAQGLSENQNLRRLVVEEVNNYLGDFLNLSRKERKVIRQVIPFYSWLKVITQITLKMPLDTPGRAVALAQIGRIGSEVSPQDVPTYLRGLIFTHTNADGTVSGISTRAATPWSTVSDLVRESSILFPGNASAQTRRDVAGNLSPFIYQTGQLLFGNKPNLGLLAQPIVGTGQALPQYRAAFPYESALYPTRTRADLLLQYLGDLRRTYDPTVASQKAGG